MAARHGIIVVLESREFDEAWAAYGRRANVRVPWLQRVLKRLPDAFADRFSPFNPKPEGLALDGPAIVVRAGHAGNESLLTHEYGHLLGYRHPPWWSWQAYVDLMGAWSLRWTDVHAVRVRYLEWRKQVPFRFLSPIEEDSGPEGAD